MKKIVLMLLCLSFISNKVFCQELNRELKLGVSAYNFSTKTSYSYFGVEYNQKVFKDILELGIHLGYDKIMIPVDYDSIKNEFEDVQRSVFTIGFNSNLFLTKLIPEVRHQDKFEVYLAIKFRKGFVYDFPDEYLFDRGKFHDLHLGIGAKYNIWKNFGLFIEYDFYQETHYRKIYSGVNFRF